MATRKDKTKAPSKARPENINDVKRRARPIDMADVRRAAASNPSRSGVTVGYYGSEKGSITREINRATENYFRERDTDRRNEATRERANAERAAFAPGYGYVSPYARRQAKKKP